MENILSVIIWKESIIKKMESFYLDSFIRPIIENNARSEKRQLSGQWQF